MRLRTIKRICPISNFARSCQRCHLQMYTKNKFPTVCSERINPFSRPFSAIGNDTSTSTELSSNDVVYCFTVLMKPTQCFCHWLSLKPSFWSRWAGILTSRPTDTIWIYLVATHVLSPYSLFNFNSFRILVHKYHASQKERFSDPWWLLYWASNHQSSKRQVISCSCRTIRNCRAGLSWSRLELVMKSSLWAYHVYPGVQISFGMGLGKKW